MSSSEPAWKRETKEKFSQLLTPGENLEAVTGGLMFGRAQHYFYLGLTPRRLILLDKESWLERVFGAVGIRLPRAGYAIHRSLLVDAALEKSGSGTTLTLQFPQSSERLVFEQLALGAEELAEAIKNANEHEVAASSIELVESARALQTFGLAGPAQSAFLAAQAAAPAGVAAIKARLPADRWQEEREAYQTAGVLLGITIGLGALMTLFSLPADQWSLEFCGEYIVGLLTAFVLLRPLFQDQLTGRLEVFGRIGITMLFFAILLVISRDYVLLAGLAGVYGAIALLLVGKPNRVRRLIAIGVFVASLVITAAVLIIWLGK